MRNFVQPGDMLDLIAPSGGVTAGVGVLIGDLFVVASTTAAAGAEFVGARSGVFDLAAATHASTQAIAVGGPVFWDDTAKTVTATGGGNRLIGVAIAAKVSTAAVCRVLLTPRLNPAAGTAIADLALASVTGVDGTGSNAASKADVDARLTTINNKVNAIIAALESAQVIAA